MPLLYANENDFNESLERLRYEQYPMLRGQVYLDHGGTTLYAKSLIDEVARDLTSNLYGSPHSQSAPSMRTAYRISSIRERLLNFFGADSKHFDLVFTANASAALKLVGECFRDHADAKRCPFWFGYHREAHTSLVGCREFAANNAHCFNTDGEVDDWIYCRNTAQEARSSSVSLLAYPGQSNMTGRRLPMDWPRKVRNHSTCGTIYTLLDAAALAPTQQLDFSDAASAPDFTVVSLYKIFGYPDLGALIVRKAAYTPLTSRKHFSGGTVDMVLTADNWHAKKETLHEQLEDGTLPFHSIVALDHAIDVHQRLYGSMRNICVHTSTLAKYAFHRLSRLQHSNGSHAIYAYNEDNHYGNPTYQGSTIAMSIVQADGTPVGYADFEKAADKEGIYLRSGTFSNPGGAAGYLNWPSEELMMAYEQGHTESNPQQTISGKSTGAIRISLGAMSTKSDIDKVVEFIRENYLELSLPILSCNLFPDSDTVSERTDRSGSVYSDLSTPDIGKHCRRFSVTPMISPLSPATSAAPSRSSAEEISPTDKGHFASTEDDLDARSERSLEKDEFKFPTGDAASSHESLSRQLSKRLRLPVSKHQYSRSDASRKLTKSLSLVKSPRRRAAASVSSSYAEVEFAPILAQPILQPLTTTDDTLKLNQPEDVTITPCTATFGETEEMCLFPDPLTFAQDKAVTQSLSPDRCHLDAPAPPPTPHAALNRSTTRGDGTSSSPLDEHRQKMQAALANILAARQRAADPRVTLAERRALTFPDGKWSETEGLKRSSTNPVRRRSSSQPPTLSPVTVPKMQTTVERNAMAHLVLMRRAHDHGSPPTTSGRWQNLASPTELSPILDIADSPVASRSPSTFSFNFQDLILPYSLPAPPLTPLPTPPPAHSPSSPPPTAAPPPPPTRTAPPRPPRPILPRTSSLSYNKDLHRSASMSDLCAFEMLADWIPFDEMGDYMNLPEPPMSASINARVVAYASPLLTSKNPVAQPWRRDAIGL